MASKLEALERGHDVEAFDCGVPVLNNWLRNTAFQRQQKGISRTWVLIDDDKPAQIIGFFAMAPRGVVPTEDLPGDMRKRMPKIVTGYTLTRLAVSAGMKGKGYGERLLNEAMEKVYRVAQQVGGFGLFVDAKDCAAAFYEKYGFEPFPDDPDTLVLRISDMDPYPLKDPEE
ncbi:GNAT family N-acetyltransferase [Pseudoduganella namucuonensis]|nr:GNAT family N-acetyltransferase [Pseudoduganella namucuonensis]